MPFITRYKAILRCVFDCDATDKKKNNVLLSGRHYLVCLFYFLFVAFFIYIWLLKTGCWTLLIIIIFFVFFRANFLKLCCEDCYRINLKRPLCHVNEDWALYFSTSECCWVSYAIIQLPPTDLQWCLQCKTCNLWFLFTYRTTNNVLIFRDQYKCYILL